MTAAVSKFNVHLEFNGGLESLFDNRKFLSLCLTETNNFPVLGQATIQDLLLYLKNFCINGRVEFFMSENSIRPGILIIINDVDWELEGELKYVLKDGDKISFISTLHGG